MLDELGLKHGTDKNSGTHDYLSRYEPFFEPLKDKPITLVEVGVDGGASLRLWNEYFPHGEIIGIDHNANAWHPAADMPRIHFVQSDATDDSFWKQFDRPISIFIDDGSHWSKDIIRTFALVWPMVKPGGLYIAEDLHADYLPEYRRGSEMTAMDYFFNIADEMNCRGEGQTGKRCGPSNIDFMQFSKSLCVIKKL